MISDEVDFEGFSTTPPDIPLFRTKDFRIAHSLGLDRERINKRIHLRPGACGAHDRAAEHDAVQT